MPDSNLHKLSALGQSVWIDYLSRDLLETGELERKMRDDAIVGVTSNPTIFQKAISQGERYDAQLKEILASGEIDAKEIFLQLSSHDIAAACDLLRPVWDLGHGLDGYVSWEVDPTLAYERDATIAEARRLHEWLERPNLYVKIPATKPGLGAIEEMIAAGRNINVTLIFSLERHQEVMEAYIHGVERLVDSGGDPSTVHSVASFFVSRVDTETDKRLDELGGHHELKGKLGIANAKLAYQNYLETFAGDRWQPLAGKGATKQRCLWASTSTKNPEYRDATVWTGADEDRWLGWLDEPKRIQERLGDIRGFAEGARAQFTTVVLLGMGGSSLAPEVLKRTFEAESLHVLDTTHPAMIRHAEDSLDLDETMFIVSSKSGGTLETLSQLAYFWDKIEKPNAFVVVTDPGSALEQLSNTRGFRVFAGEPTIGGRYSALSPFGIVPA